MKITFSGYYGKQNCGDDAFTLALPKLFPAKTKFEFTYGAPKNNDDLFILGAGNILLDYFLKPIPKDKEMYVLGGALAFDDEIKLLKEYKFKELIVRNKHDAALLTAHGFKAKYAPDVVFTMDVPKDLPNQIEKDPTKKMLGIMITDHLNTSPNRPSKITSYGHYFRLELAEIIEALSPWYHPVFIPMSHKRVDYDLRSLYEIESYLGYKTKATFVPPLPPRQMLKLVSELDLLLTMRFHGMIFATIAGTPFINLGLTKKSVLFCEENGLSDLSVPPFSLNTERFLKEQLKAAEKPDVSDKLLSISQNNKKELEVLKHYIKENWLNVKDKR